MPGRSFEYNHLWERETEASRKQVLGWSLNGAARWPSGRIVNRYNLALLFLALAAIPLFYVSGWLGLTALMAIYALLTRLANKDFDRHSGSRSALVSDVVHLRRPTPPFPHDRSDFERR
jgi:hypothetical protein